MKSWIFPVLLCVAMVGASFGLRAVALADGAADVAPLDAGVGPPTPAVTTAPVDPSAWDFLGLPWGDIFTVLMVVLGALVSILRVLAPLTKWTGDNWLLGKLEWLVDLLAKILVPARFRSKSLGGGKSAGDPPPVAP